MDRELAFAGDENDHLEDVACAIRAENEPAVRVLACILDRQCVVDGVFDVFVSDAVATGGLVDLHTRLSYYESRPVRDSLEWRGSSAPNGTWMARRPECDPASGTKSQVRHGFDLHVRAGLIGVDLQKRVPDNLDLFHIGHIREGRAHAWSPTVVRMPSAASLCSDRSTMRG